MQLIASLATLAAAISSVNALGSAIINNNCAFDVYMWAVDAQRNPSSPTVIKAGSQYTEGYHTPPSGGVSLKLSTTTSNQYVTQFEYTVQSFLSNPFVWYDGSNVNCVDSECPFWGNGINLKTSNPSCPTRDCATDVVCSGFYTLYNDDVNSLSCDDTSDVIMTLCTVNTGLGGGSGSSSASGSGSSAGGAQSPAQKQAVAAPTTTAKPAITNEAVATTFVTAYATPNAKREAKPAHHNHMHFHRERAAAIADKA